MRIGTIIQARTTSTRLPGKVLKLLPYFGSLTVLQQVIRRSMKSKKSADIIIATTKDKEDDAIIKLCDKEEVKWFRGDKDNVLQRYYLTAKENNLDMIIRITSDCPCIDANIIDMTVEKHINLKAEYTSTLGFPRGLGVEVLSFDTLEKAYKEARYAFEKEHVSPYIYRTNRKVFKIHSFGAPDELAFPEIRVTLDTEEDYTLLCALFDYLYAKNEYFNAYDIVSLFKKKPWLKFINKKVVQKTI